MERADIRSLRELTDAANELLEKNSGKYTDDTAKALQDAVAHAEEILGKDGKPMQRSRKLTIRSWMLLSDLR